MFCSKCGVRLSDDSQFCHACGSRVIKNDNVAQDNDLDQQTYSTSVEYNNESNKNHETGSKLSWIKNNVLIFIAFIVVTAFGKVMGKVLYRHFPYIIGMLIAASVISLVQYFLVKRFGNWEDNDKAAWICAVICFIAHIIYGVYFSIPVLVITGIIMLLKR